MLGELQGDGRPVDSAIPPGGILNQTVAGVTDILGDQLDRITVEWAAIGPTVGLRPDAFLARSADVLGSVRITQPDAFLDLLAEAGAAPHFLGTLAEKVVLARRAPPAPTLT
jgi:uncharacterized protein (DUF4213/DUF364 family)